MRSSINSDKDYWHRYLPEYARALAGCAPENVMEFGVFHGGSMRWLANLYPEANIYGVDLFPVQPSWPRSPRIRYIQADQGDYWRMAEMFRVIGRKFDIVIEDGSHRAEHQVNCLRAAKDHVKPGGFYVAEDLHAVYRRDRATLLHILLAIERFRAMGGGASEFASEFAPLAGEFFTLDELAELNRWIGDIHPYRRATLPLQCYNCRRSNGFDLVALKCGCGADLYAGHDSISFVLRAA